MKAFCGTTSLRVTVLASFNESAERGTKTIRESKKKKNNKLDKRSKTTNLSKIEAICAQNVWNFIFMLEFSYLLRSSKRNFLYIAY